MHVCVDDGKLFVSYPEKKYTGICQHLHKHDQLTEATYKQIAAKIDDNFLQQKLRAAALEGVRLAGVQDKSLIFYVKSSNYTENETTYTNVVHFDEWDDFIDDPTASPLERARLLMYLGNVKLHCTCPSFLFWGYQYLLHQMGSAVMPEDRPSVKRNPLHRGIVCKHLNRTLKAFPFYTGDLARYIRANYKVADDKKKTADLKTRAVDLLRMNPKASVKYEDVI
jgi:hypothetical protein